MDVQDKNGVTKRNQLMQVLEATPEDSSAHQSALEELAYAPELPFYLEHIWQWFWELNSRRTSGGFSQNPITWADFIFWNNVKRKQVRPIEFEILEMMDNLYLKYMNKKSDQQTKGNSHGNIPNKKSKKR